jgi:DNA helicase HerA-like ATPase
MAQNRGGDLQRLADLLTDPPDEINLMELTPKANKLALDIAGLLKAAITNNRLLASDQQTHDIKDLLSSPTGRTRVSVINLSGLGSLSNQQIFLSQLVSGLFTWIRNNPSKGVGGLLVIDEAKEFMPSIKSTPCKEALIRYSAQARKYGYGLVMATQEPKSVDNAVISNSATHFFGKQNSPVAIKTAEDLLGKNDVISKLKQGNFYLRSEGLTGGLTESVKIKTPLSLSCHGASLNFDEIIELSQISRD